jgi:hypothetical protein
MPAMPWSKFGDREESWLSQIAIDCPALPARVAVDRFSLRLSALPSELLF